jgi:hypothetical protein
MKITGACHCTAIQFEAEVDPDNTAICHCTDCQTLTATAFRVSVQTNTLTFTAGVPKIYVKTAESGRKREQAFCGDCGSPIYSSAPGPEPKKKNLRTGVIHQRAQLPPRRQDWTRSKVDWLDTISSLPGIEKDA